MHKYMYTYHIFFQSPLVRVSTHNSKIFTLYPAKTFRLMN